MDIPVARSTALSRRQKALKSAASAVALLAVGGVFNPTLAEDWYWVSADFTGQTVSARAETGYRFTQNWRGYLAFHGHRFAAQGFTEKGNAGDNFILTNDDQTGAQHRMEVGARYENIFRMPDGRQLFLRSQIAWLRSHTSTPDVSASFSNLAGSRFAISGTSAAADALAVATAVDFPLTNEVFVGTRVDAEWTGNSRGVSGQTTFSIRW